MQVNLSPRLATILNMLSPVGCLADIGSDHGFLITTAVSRGIAAKGVAVEVHIAPFEQSQKTVRSTGLQARIDVRLGDGLDALAPDEAEAIVIAGMGGGTMRDILCQGRAKLDNVRYMVLQPNNDAAELRGYLLDVGYTVVNETLVEDGEFIYQVMRVELGSEVEKYSSLELEYGRLNLRNRCPLLQRIIERDLRHWLNVLSQLDKANPQAVIDRRSWVEQRVSDLKEVFSTFTP